MITSAVSKEQIETWKEIYMLRKDSLKPNRISGEALDTYFRETYQPERIENRDFKEVVYQNAKEQNPTLTPDQSKISTYLLDGDIYVGIDLRSGYFQVECEDINKMIPVWDDLFFTRGLSERDLAHFVLTAQYILISQKNASIDLSDTLTTK